MEMKLGEVAAYCDIVMDGYYTAKDVEALCHTLIARMRKMRGELVLQVVSELPRVIH